MIYYEALELWSSLVCSLQHCFRMRVMRMSYVLGRNQCLSLVFFVALYSFFRLSCRFHDLYVSKFVCCHFDFASFWLKFFSVMTLHAKKWTFNLVAFVMVCVKAKTFCDFFFSCVFLKRFKWLAMPFLIADSIPQKSTMWHKQVKRLDLHNKRWSYDCDCGGLQ